MRNSTHYYKKTLLIPLQNPELKQVQTQEVPFTLENHLCEMIYFTLWLWA